MLSDLSRYPVGKWLKAFEWIVIYQAESITHPLNYQSQMFIKGLSGLISVFFLYETSLELEQSPFNWFILKRDEHLISPDSINIFLSNQVMRIYKIIEKLSLIYLQILRTT